MRFTCLLALLLLATVLPPATPATEELRRFPSSVLSIRTRQSTEWFNVWIADTSQRQEQGLMYQKWLPTDWSMLFPEQAPRVKSMWMKNTLIPLDMLFIDPKGRIVYIRERATPESEQIISYPVAVKAVLELSGGTCARLGIRVGDQVHHALFGASPGGPAVVN
ncbi:MAG TPA: DUF192 domain-containing protein [Steroidobacteraceae bacterium]|nr:DUF192 domain-containing protein [Steroidobacteraceae bacterium]